MGHSDYVNISIIVSIGLLVVFSVLAVLISKVRSGRA
jgi:hypothetical protein